MELLVVIAIIGLLSTMALISLDNARKKARDSKRASAIAQVRKALELYYDANNAYPSTALVNDCDGGNPWDNALGPALASYLADIPNDSLYPQNPWPYCFYYKSGDHGNCPGTGHEYTIIFSTEANSNLDFNHYSIFNDGGAAGRYCVYPGN